MCESEIAIEIYSAGLAHDTVFDSKKKVYTKRELMYSRELMTQQTTPKRRLKYYLGGSIVGSLAGVVAIGLITSPVLLSILTGELPGYADYAVLAVIGWGAYLSQQVVNGETNDRPDEAEFGWMVSVLLTILMVMYYNVALIISVVGAGVLAVSGLPTVAVAFAVLYPMYEMWTAENGYFVSVAGVLALLIASGMIASQLAQNVSASSIRLDEFPLRLFRGRRRI